mmetsp:Transcript_20029/g.40826  ORF Transcript_20029/g.40826 Transcript_20029/m.40826 type:complete len:238 (+) Transcript_20029:47-760(+)
MSFLVFTPWSFTPTEDLLKSGSANHMSMQQTMRRQHQQQQSRYAQPTRAPQINDGGVLVVLVVLVAGLTLATIASIALYATATAPAPNSRGQSCREARLARLLTGWGNVGNGIAHMLFVLLLIFDADLSATICLADERCREYFENAENPSGPVFLLVLNLAIGLVTLHGGGPRVPTAWNAFAFVTGIFIPAVWPRFISEGLATWPYLAVFLWLAIFVCESLAFFASVTWFALKDVPA